MSKIDTDAFLAWARAKYIGCEYAKKNAGKKYEDYYKKRSDMYLCLPSIVASFIRDLESSNNLFETEYNEDRNRNSIY